MNGLQYGPLSVVIVAGIVIDVVAGAVVAAVVDIGGASDTTK